MENHNFQWEKEGTHHAKIHHWAAHGASGLSASWDQPQNLENVLEISLKDAPFFWKIDLQN